MIYFLSTKAFPKHFDFRAALEKLGRPAICLEEQEEADHGENEEGQLGGDHDDDEEEEEE